MRGSGLSVSAVGAVLRERVMVSLAASQRTRSGLGASSSTAAASSAAESASSSSAAELYAAEAEAAATAAAAAAATSQSGLPRSSMLAPSRAVNEWDTVAATPSSRDDDGAATAALWAYRGMGSRELNAELQALGAGPNWQGFYP